MTLARAVPRAHEKDDATLASLLSVADFEPIAATALPPSAWDYFRSGAGDERTLRRNEEAWREWRIFHRVLVDVSKRSTVCRALGIPSAFPLWIAPTAMQCMCCPEGECDTARAAASVGAPMVLSSLSTRSVEDVCAAAGTGAVLMQIYIAADRGFTRELVQRAERAGCRGIVVTVDTPVWGVRERDLRNSFRVPDGLRIENLERAGMPSGHSGRGMGECLGWTIDASLSWRDLEALCSWTSLPVIVKGVCRADDAQLAVQSGAEGVIVSNHGGRQLDGAPATAESLPEIADRIGDCAAVFVDGGIRRGVDLLRARALGASIGLIGRPILWGLAAAGERGVRRVLEILRHEFDLAMALAGCPALESITRDLVRRGP